MYLKNFLIALSVFVHAVYSSSIRKDLSSFKPYCCEEGRNELKSIKSVFATSDRIYFFLEDKFIVFPFDETDMLMRSGNKYRLDSAT